MSLIRRLDSLIRTPVTYVAGTAALLIAILVPQFAAAGVDYPPGSFTLSLSVSTVPPGGNVTATVNGCTASVDIQLSIDGTSITTQGTCAPPAAAGFMRSAARPAGAAAGSLTLNLTAPMTPGTYTLRATELGGQQRTATAELTVAAPTPTTVPTGSLPSTGSDVMRVSASAAAVVLIGIGAVIVSRRRRIPLSR